MKKTIVLLLFLISVKGHSQLANSMFSKDPIINLENFQKQRLYFGFYLGFNSFDFKIDYKENKIPDNDIFVKKTTGFNVGLVADLKLQEYISLRFEPGLYYTSRDLIYPENYFSSATLEQRTRQVNSTYLHFPLLVKFLSLRTGNIRPYLVGGASATLNLSSNSKSQDDNSANIFRVKSWSTNYEMGFGIDFFSEYFIFSPSIRGVFGINDELIRDNVSPSSYTDNIQSLKNRAVFINFTFH
jgi:hypothetical protein